MRSVWVVRLSDHDLSAARQHGTLQEPIFTRATSPHDTAAQLEVLNRRVLPYAHADDLVVAGAGPATMVAVLVAAMVSHFGCVCLLVWDQNKRRYVERRVGPQAP